jgi:hypothetical protein
MLLKILYKNILTALNADEYGNSSNITEFNDILDQEQIKFIKRKVEEQYSLPAEGKENSNTIFSSKLLYPLISKETVVPTAGIIDVTEDLTYDYLYWGTMTTSATYNGQIRDIDLATNTEVTDRKTNLLSPSVKERPVAEIIGDEIRILPTNISGVDFTYIKKPATPFLDFYSDANYNRVYMAAAATHILTTGETYIGSDGITRTAGYNVTARTIELEFHEDFHSEFFDQLLALFSLRQGDQFTNQIAMTKQQMEDAK